LHLKGSSRKEDRVYAKRGDIDKYIKIGYVYGLKCKPDEIKIEPKQITNIEVE